MRFITNSPIRNDWIYLTVSIVLLAVDGNNLPCVDSNQWPKANTCTRTHNEIGERLERVKNAQSILYKSTNNNEQTWYSIKNSQLFSGFFVHFALLFLARLALSFECRDFYSSFSTTTPNLTQVLRIFVCNPQL